MERERLTNVGTKGEIFITDNDETRALGQKEAAYKRLKEYEDAEEQEMLLRFPCKLGDSVWVIYENSVCETKAVGFSFGKTEADDIFSKINSSSKLHLHCANTSRGEVLDIPSSLFGRYAFFDKEDAAKAFLQGVGEQFKTIDVYEDVDAEYEENYEF
jgi:hypothetical protein